MTNQASSKAAIRAVMFLLALGFSRHRARKPSIKIIAFILWRQSVIGQHQSMNQTHGFGVALSGAIYVVARFFCQLEHLGPR